MKPCLVAMVGNPLRLQALVYKLYVSLAVKPAEIDLEDPPVPLAVVRPAAGAGVHTLPLCRFSATSLFVLHACEQNRGIGSPNRFRFSISPLG